MKKDINTEIENAFNSIAKLAIEYNKEFHDKTKNALKISDEYTYLLSNYGWYISAEMSWKSVFDIFVALKNDNISFVNEQIISYYTRNIESIETTLIQKYPKRKSILLEAFKAHKMKMFFSSTILFISLTDGICDGKLFRGKNALNSFFTENNVSNRIKEVLDKESAINVDTRKIDKSNYFSELNRHGVVHGLHTDFGNEINSLKALSMLCFITSFK